MSSRIQSPRRRPRWLTLPLVWLALPFAWFWVCQQQRRILRDGRSLSDEERRDATAAGVVLPERIRLMVVAIVPTPGASLLRGLAAVTRFPLSPPAGMALGHGIYLDERVSDSRSTFVHECVHVAQYERLGGIRPFLRQYLEECLRESYWDSAMEAEANAVSARVCQRDC
ncbi:MAG: hypothetical protein KDN20_13740 [Verrucomicrobiae bacterium]|nr:hypothetical protein [Verrucomicrobiae bacterium]